MRGQVEAHHLASVWELLRQVPAYSEIANDVARDRSCARPDIDRCDGVQFCRCPHLRTDGPHIYRRSLANAAYHCVLTSNHESQQPSIVHWRYSTDTLLMHNNARNASASTDQAVDRSDPYHPYALLHQAFVKRFYLRRPSSYSTLGSSGKKSFNSLSSIHREVESNIVQNASICGRHSCHQTQRLAGHDTVMSEPLPCAGTRSTPEIHH